MSSLERKLERIICLIEELRSETSKGALLLVEGERDTEVLRAIGIECKILAVKSRGKNLQDVLDEIGWFGDREIILLMDFDRRGRELATRLVQNLERMKIKFNLGFWRELSRLLENDLKDIEGLATYIETLRKKIGYYSSQQIWHGEPPTQFSSKVKDICWRKNKFIGY